MHHIGWQFVLAGHKNDYSNEQCTFLYTEMFFAVMDTVERFL